MDKNHKPCPLCGKQMNRQSKICQDCYLSKIKRPENYLEQVCPKCGKKFIVHISQKIRGQGIYCSKSCARSGRPSRIKEKPVVCCYECGKEFEKYKSESKKNVGELNFCSPQCWYKHNQRENHYMWEGGQDERMNPENRIWRQAIWKRDHGKCRLCGAKTELEAHHIKKFGKHPLLRCNVNNGILLCHKHHSMTFQHEEEYEQLFTILISEEMIR
jgi:hypothetical protein